MTILILFAQYISDNPSAHLPPEIHSHIVPQDGPAKVKNVELTSASSRHGFAEALATLTASVRRIADPWNGMRAV